MSTLKSFVIFSLWLYFASSIHAKVHVRVINMLQDGRSMNIHCQSKDDDLGNIILKNGDEIEWSSLTIFGVLHYFSVMCNGKT